MTLDHWLDHIYPKEDAMTLKDTTSRIRKALDAMGETAYESNAHIEAEINLRIAVGDLERMTATPSAPAKVSDGMLGEVDLAETCRQILLTPFKRGA